MSGNPDAVKKKIQTGRILRPFEDPPLANLHCSPIFELVVKYGKGALLAKVDIEDAFRLIPIHPSDYSRLGLIIDGRYYYNRSLPMGCSCSCHLFESFSCAIHWIMEYKTGAELVYIIDDFLFIAPPRTSKCQQDLENFLSLAGDIGCTITHSETEKPTTCLEFRGITIDSMLLEARLPIVKCRSLIESFLARDKVTLKEIQSLVGVLNFACKVVRPG